MRQNCVELGPITSSRGSEECLCTLRIVGRPSVTDEIERSRVSIAERTARRGVGALERSMALKMVSIRRSVSVFIKWCVQLHLIRRLSHETCETCAQGKVKLYIQLIAKDFYNANAKAFRLHISLKYVFYSDIYFIRTFRKLFNSTNLHSRITSWSCSGEFHCQANRQLESLSGRYGVNFRVELQAETLVSMYRCR